MAFRFQRRVRLFPGARLNVSKSGVGLSTGIRGARISAGNRGIWSSVGIPGSGLSHRQKLNSGSKPDPRRRMSDGANSDNSVNLQIRWKADGRPPEIINTTTGEVLSPEIADRIIHNNRQAVISQAKGVIAQLHAEQEAKIRIHAETPSPDHTDELLAIPAFDLPEPARPALRRPGLLTRLIPSWRRKHEAGEARRQTQWRQTLEEWQAAKAEHKAACEKWRTTCSISREGQPAAQETVLSKVLEGIDWPYETTASFEIKDQALHMDVDLPEIEDLPTGEPRFNQRELVLTEKPFSERARRLNYAEHVHGIAVRLTGTAFAALPAIEEVTISGFSQRPEPSTGQIQDEYLFSICADRDSWSNINFERIAELNPIDILSSFRQVKNMTKTGIFRAVEPL